MSTLDEVDLFSSGPHGLQVGAWPRERVRRGFAGLDGELVLDLGLRSRLLSHTGRLQAAAAAELDILISEIEAFADGQLHTLEDNRGRSFPRVLIEEFTTAGPIRCGRGFWCDYTIRFRQLP
jgi:hypothetical protein